MIDAAKCRRLCQHRPRSPHAGFRFASALRGVAGVATYRFTRSCYTVRFSMWQPPRPLAKATAAAATRFRRGHFSKAGSPTQCGSTEHATAATRGVWQHKRGRLPRGFAEGISQRPFPRGVAAQAARRLPRGAVAAQAQTAATWFRRGHFPKAGSSRVAAQVPPRLPRGACGRPRGSRCCRPRSRGEGGRCVSWGEGGRAPKPGGRGAVASGGRQYFLKFAQKCHLLRKSARKPVR